MLRDVLENGPPSQYYRFFDITWDHPDEGMQRRLLAPFLGGRYVECLESGEIKLGYNAQGFTVDYYDLKLPLSIVSYLTLLGHEPERIQVRLDQAQSDCTRFFDLLDNLESLSLTIDPAKRRDHVRSIKETLWDLYCGNPIIKQFVDENLLRFNEDRGGSRRINLLDGILSRQMFRLCHWKVACQEINYRRFFDINELITLCQEKDAVFDHTHGLLTKLIAEGIVSGVRIDHVDGLRDPADYLKRLRHRFGDIYVVIEKILDPAEKIPDSWPVQGTTGYEFGSIVTGLFVQNQNEEKITKVYTRFSKRQDSFENVLVACKRKVLESQMAGDLDNLTGLVKRIAARTLAGRDFTTKWLKEALIEILVRFQVYRTYIDLDGLRKADEKYIRSAVELSVLHRPDRQQELAFMQRLLLGECADELAAGCTENIELYKDMTARFQQLTAPLMAKGMEDTALYIYNRLISLNEVGGDPHRFGCIANGFHEFIKDRAGHWPHTMNSTATHDSKRGEDVRARINVLSELPEEWENALDSWQALNRKNKIRLNGEDVPDQNEEYLLYQTLLGVFPREDVPGDFFIERISRYLVKAVREAKIHSSWTEVNTEYEEALAAFAQKILHPVEGGPFLQAFLPFFKKVAFYGIWNTLSQTLLKITAPGVPDFYQGTELFDFHLVDPDNRGAIDFETRKRFLAEILNTVSSDPLRLIRELLANRRDGRLKLFLIAQALRTRNAETALFQQGSYEPLATAGRFKEHVIAFARIHKTHCSVTVVPRFLTGLVKENQNPLGQRIWRDTEIILPQNNGSRWKNIFTQEILSSKASLKIGTVLRHFPCALLVSA
jgi:(1->4)-alpha-D-glucan 1-alpha-D-glucosylmutase